MGVDTQLVRTIDQAPVWVIGDGNLTGFNARAELLRDAGVTVLDVARGQGGTLSMDAIWKELASRQILSILVEGGGQVASSSLRSGRIQRIYVFIAPVFFGKDGVPAFPDLPPSKVGEWRSSERESLGSDTRIVLDHRSLYEALGKL